MNEGRNLIHDRLLEDLVGPSSIDEVLKDRPSDRYLTGILFARRTELREDEDEGLATASGDSEDPTGDEQISQSVVAKPSTAGVSFSVRSPGVIHLRVRVRGGTYQKVDPETAASGEEGLAMRPRWQRRSHEIQLAMECGVNGSTEVALASEGLPGFVVHLVTAADKEGAVATVTLVNTNEAGRGESQGKRPDELALFQAEVEVEAIAPTQLIARPQPELSDEADTNASRLLYWKAREFAVGHTSSAEWEAEDNDTVARVRTSWLPREQVRLVSADGAPEIRNAVKAVQDKLGLDPLDAETLATAGPELGQLLDSISRGYRNWIAAKDLTVPTLPPDLQPQASLHLENCREVADRIEAGISHLLSQDECRAAFAAMNRVMNLQRQWAQRSRKAVETADGPQTSSGLRWFPFQLAFILLSLESVSNPESTNREAMDLLWFPTGGGKTEAYLGLIAYTGFLRRIRRRNEADNGGGVSCIMRYTLRLLTLQQFQRASALILACEFVRRGNSAPAELPDLRTSAKFSVGLWVGGDATPNKLEEALAALSNANAPVTPRQLTSCPCCGGKLRWAANTANSDIVVTCGNAACELATAVAELPVRTVDQLIYADPPTLLFATVDKFAQIVRSADTAALFNTGFAPPPDLIIQDELHLISGPLGTLAGLYEIAVDLICSRDGPRPKVIGSTATIRRADDQIRALFDRKAALFPPPGLDISDSCFAYTEPDARTREYVGVTTAGRSAKFTLQAVYASILQSSGAITDPDLRDGYHTLVGYFNALRELGGALVLAQDDIGATLDLVAQRRSESTRSSREVVELTSRVSQQEIREILDRLELHWKKTGSVDVLLATNMISVGVDVSRLGMMVVMGQPKGIAEYIQATSRVGRDRRAPGLVVTVLNANKARDRAHFENFKGVHRALYRGVEATSVTPFAPRARERALHGALIAAVRHLVVVQATDPALQATSLGQIDSLVDSIRDRATHVDAQEVDATVRDLRRIVSLWRKRSPSLTSYWNDRSDISSLLMAAERAAARDRTGLSAARAWPALNSMRTVEASTPFRLVEKLRHGQTSTESEEAV